MELIVALDVDNIFEAEALIDMLKPRVKYFKVGSRLFTAAGPQVLDLINKKNALCFLDLKYHDIPSVVSDAVRCAADKNVFSISLHISGGRQMLEACVKVPSRPRLWGITVLTSMDDDNLREIGVCNPVTEQVRVLGELAKSAGIDGVVSSPMEIPVTKKIGGLEIIVPGIRTRLDPKCDQKRILSPHEAKDLGADFIVVGRPIIKAKNPLGEADRILSEIE